MRLLTLLTSLPSIKRLLADFPHCIHICEMRPQHCREPRVSKNTFAADLNTEHWQTWGLPLCVLQPFKHTAPALLMRGCETSPLVTGTERVDVSISETLWRLWLFLCEAYFLKTWQIFVAVMYTFPTKTCSKLRKLLIYKCELQRET